MNMNFKQQLSWHKAGLFVSYNYANTYALKEG